MSTIVTRAGKGSPLTNTEVDSNFTNLNTDKVETLASADGSIVITGTGASRDISVSQNSPASVLLEQVRNTTGATLTKGTAVYISGATGQIPTVSKALATGDATSAQTLGLITSNLANNANGYVTIIGLVSDINTSAYTDGQQLYLSPTTAGTLTATKPYAPQHLVYMAVVAHAHPTQGKLIVKVQNGYELDEIHNVSAQSPVTGQTIVYNSATSLWEKNTVSLTAGINGILPVANGGTGAALTTSNFVFAGPSSGSPAAPSFRALTTADISGLSSGSVSSVALALPSIMTVSGSPVTSTGTLTGTLTTQAVNAIFAGPSSGAAAAPTFRSLTTADIPTLNQNTTGTAANVTGIVAVANGGSGTATPSIVAGTNVTVTGTWPNQTIAAAGGGGSGSNIFLANNFGGF